MLLFKKISLSQSFSFKTYTTKDHVERQCCENSLINCTYLANAEEYVCRCSRRRMSCRKWASACRASMNFECSDRCSGSMSLTGTRIHLLPATAFDSRDTRMRRSMEGGAPSVPKPPHCRLSRRLPIGSRPQVRQHRSSLCASLILRF